MYIMGDSVSNYVSEIMNDVVDIFKNVMGVSYLKKPAKTELQTFVDNDDINKDAKM